MIEIQSILSALRPESALPLALGLISIAGDGDGAEQMLGGATALGLLLRRSVDWQRRIALAIDRMLPQRYRVQGRTFFRESLVPRYLSRGQTIYDVGGGALPFLAPEVKRRVGARVVGVDISEEELARAPEQSYDRTLCTDIATHRGEGDADLIICQSVLEHVRDVRGAFHALSSILHPGGRLLVFVPNRNSLFARLNLLLPELVKRELLFTLYPEKRETSGFPAFYDRCTPRDFRELAAESGLIVEREEHFFFSTYFLGLLPIYVLWRIWILLGERIFGEQASSTFCMVLRKPSN